MAQRKTGTPLLPSGGGNSKRGAGGNFRGAVTTDVAARQTVVPFTGNPDDALLGDGTFGKVNATTVKFGGITDLVWDEGLGNYLVPR